MVEQQRKVPLSQTSVSSFKADPGSAHLSKEALLYVLLGKCCCIAKQKAMYEIGCEVADLVVPDALCDKAEFL